MAHPDLPLEQAHLDRAYGRLEAVRAEVQAQLREAFRERGGTFQSYTERDIRVRQSLNRLEKLQLGREALIFGRIDRLATAEAFHIGRLAVSDSDHEPLVVDWRAPVAEPFYRATGAHPMGLRLRRHFLTEGRRVVDLEDELFSPGSSEGAADVLGLSGPTVLLAALERAHTGRMRDIVATVQAEQDEIIRAPLPGPLLVQGGPGTGKTAVALHRAAYLLYTHRFPLETQGVLVLGPNPTFLRYIDQVLPSLGETGVELSTATGLYKRVQPTAGEPTDVARVKGDARMAKLLRRAVRQRERPLRRDVEVPYGPAVLRLTARESEEIIAAARRRPSPHNVRRRLVESLLWERFTAQLERRQSVRSPRTLTGPTSAPKVGRNGSADRAAAASNGHTGPAVTEGYAPGNAPPISPVELGAELRRRRDVVEILDRMWPRLTPEQLLHDLYGAPPLLAASGRGLLSPEEIELLHRARRPTADDVAWTAADIALLDEARSLLGAARGRGGGGREPYATASLEGDGGGHASGGAPRHAGGGGDLEGGRPRTYGHIVVDEAQDLTPMELRMVGRRSLSGSMTLVGDIAQATGPWAPSSWEEVAAHLPAHRGWRAAGLTVSYRAPAEVMQLAGRVLAVALPGATPPEPVRHTGHDPVFVRAGEDLGTAITLTVRSEVAAVAAAGDGEDGSVGVLVPAPLLAAARGALGDDGQDFGEVGAGALDARVTLLALGDAKGLEFDSVVVVEPSLIVSTSAQGLRALYVALTRCTRRLAIVYQGPLPEVLRDPS